MFIEDGQIKSNVKPMYEIINGKTVFMPSWQRPYDWKSDMAEPIIQKIKIAAGFPVVERKKNQPYLGSIVVYDDNVENRCVVADGHSRAMTFGIIIKALHNICCERGYSIHIGEHFGYHYDLDIACEQYMDFVTKHTGTTNYADVYKAAYKILNEYIYEEDEAAAIWDVLQHHVVVNVINCSDEDMAHEYFMELNASGKPMSKIEVISSVLQRYTVKFQVELNYDYYQLENIIEAYYYIVAPRDIPKSFNNYALKSFLMEYVVKDRQHLIEFKEYLKKINRFTTTLWYNVLKNIDSGKSIKVGYTLAGANYKKPMDLSGADKNVNDFLTNLVVAGIVAFALDSNTGGTTTKHYSDIKGMIGQCTDLDDITAFVQTWSNNHYEIDFDTFAKELDGLNDDQQRAILFVTYMLHNRNSVPVRVHLEDAFPKNPGVAWRRLGMAADKKNQDKLAKSLGNKLLIDSNLNEELGNSSPMDKLYAYEEFINNNTAYNYPENMFDVNEFTSKKKEYLDVRRNRYARKLADTDMGKLLIKQSN